MDLQRYTEDIQRQLVQAGQAGGDETRALAERLVAPLDAAIRLALQDALSAAADEITCELAPGSVELRLRGRNPEFVVTPPPVDRSLDDLAADGRDAAPGLGSAQTKDAAGDADDGAMSRINLRMPEQLKARIDQAAATAGLSVNSWLVQAAAAAVDRGDLAGRRPPRAPHSSNRYTGWVR